MGNILLREDKDGLCTLTLNRPEKHNALNTELFRRLDQEFARLEGQADTIGCVVLRANGKSFCAGADLVAARDETRPPPLTFKPGVIERMANLPQIVVAAVHSTCVTGGLELALGADLIVASHSARFADTHGKWGYVAGWGMIQRLPRRIGMGQAKLMMTTGRYVGAEEAHRIGLVDMLVADEGLSDTVAALARDILANSWHSNRGTKKLMIDTEGMRLADGLAHEYLRYPGVAPDFKERVAQFGKKD